MALFKGQHSEKCEKECVKLQTILMLFILFCFQQYWGGGTFMKFPSCKKEHWPTHLYRITRALLHNPSEVMAQ